MKKLLLSLLVISISFPLFGQDSSRTEFFLYNKRLISEFSLDELKNLRAITIDSEDEDLAKIYSRIIQIKYKVLEYKKQVASRPTQEEREARKKQKAEAKLKKKQEKEQKQEIKVV